MIKGIKVNYAHLTVATILTVLLSVGLSGKVPLPACPFEQFLGFCCPMCGSTRAWLTLLSTGNLLQSLRFNPIFWLWGFWCGIAYGDLWLRAITRHKPSCGQILMQSVGQNRGLLIGHLGLSLGTVIYLNLPTTIAWRLSQNIFW
jgi:hypothetical protein